jgi:isoleucyl-tRNA synthetase
MQGYHVRRKAGWDTHGLPVEIEVEKEIGSKHKKDIETYGVAAFNKKCKESVLRYIDVWKTVYRPHRVLGRPRYVFYFR